jgi:hypothetical protein
MCMFFCRGPLILMKAGKSIVFNWPERDTEGFEPYYQTNILGMNKICWSRTSTVVCGLDYTGWMGHFCSQTENRKIQCNVILSCLLIVLYTCCISLFWYDLNLFIQDLSAINRQRASKPAYPYRKGRLGYARLQQKLVSIYKCYDLINCIIVL